MHQIQDKKIPDVISWRTVKATTSCPRWSTENISSANNNCNLENLSKINQKNIFVTTGRSYGLFIQPFWQHLAPINLVKKLLIQNTTQNFHVKCSRQVHRIVLFHHQLTVTRFCQYFITGWDPRKKPSIYVTLIRKTKMG